MKIIIPGRPVPAVRMTGRGKWKKPEAQRYLDYKAQVGWQALAQTTKPITGYVAVNVRVYLWGKNTPMGNDGDCDNYLKAGLDALNGIVWVDDRQVIKATVEKIATRAQAEERMEIYVEEVFNLV